MEYHDSEMTLELYENQISTANELINHYKNDSGYCVLFAQMQSGKTDTFMLTGCELVREGIVKYIVIFSGNREKELSAQTKNQEDFWDKYRKYLREYEDCSPETADKIVRHISRNCFEVVWGPDLDKHKTKGNTLYIWEESHYAQSQKQKPDIFLQKQKLKPDGSISGNGNLMLSVSATPFSELIDNEELGQDKKIVKMFPGKGYIGVKELFENKCIQSYDNLNATLKVLLEQLETKSGVRKVGLVRITNKNEAEITEICKSQGIPLIIYDQKWDGDNINKLLSETETPLVICLRNKVRMGKQINKENVAWCLETCLKSNSDTLLQGLVGRCCGYPSTGSSTEIQIYLPKSIIDANVIENYIKDNISAPAMNVKKVKEKNFYRTIPERVELDLSDWDKNPDDLKYFIRDFINSPQFKSVNEERFPGSTDWLKEIVVKYPDNIRFSDWTQSSYEGHLERMTKANENKLVLPPPGPSCGYTVSDGTELRVWSKERRPSPGQKKWNIFLQFLTPEITEKVTTTKREVFCTKTEDGTDIMANGGASLLLPIESAEDETKMYNCINEIIELSMLSFELLPINKITSNATNDDRKWSGILVTESVLKSLKPNGKIYKKIYETHKIKLEVIQMRGRRPENLPERYKRLASINFK